ncbi:MAG TPA: hypothetical protein VEA77_01540 [Hyphomicrobium sp.]|nr:hypothetical protein [Hyphomicrobium sp.]
MRPHSFELLELPDGRWCVAKTIADTAASLVAGSFARLETPADALSNTPVGCYASRDDAELAIQRVATNGCDPLSMFAPWLPRDTLANES